MKKKAYYEAPSAELIIVRFEKELLTGSVLTNSVNSGYDEENVLGDLE